MTATSEDAPVAHARAHACGTCLVEWLPLTTTSGRIGGPFEFKEYRPTVVFRSDSQDITPAHHGEPHYSAVITFNDQQRLETPHATIRFLARILVAPMLKEGAHALLMEGHRPVARLTLASVADPTPLEPEAQAKLDSVRAKVNDVAGVLGMYLAESTYAAFVAYLDGFADGAGARIIINGFQAWLAARNGSRTNVSAAALVLSEAFAIDGHVSASELKGDQHTHAIHEYVHLFGEFADAGAP